MRWWPFGQRTPDDAEASGGGTRLLIASMGCLLWYFPETARHRVVQKGRGKYYGMVPWSADWDQDGRLLVVSRPNQSKDDRLLLLDHRDGRTQRKIPLASRDTHHAVRSGNRCFLTDSFRGRVLEYALPALELVRVYDRFGFEHHINTLLVEDQRLLVLCHNRGKSRLVVLDRDSGEILDAFEDVGEESHDIATWRDQFVICDSRGGALILVDRATKACRTAFREEGSFTKGLAVEGDVAWFAISKTATRRERLAVACDLVAYDLAADRQLWRRSIPSKGLVNSIVTASGLSAQVVSRS